MGLSVTWLMTVLLISANLKNGAKTNVRITDREPALGTRKFGL